MLQREDPRLSRIINYLESGTLPTDEKEARELALTKSQYVLEDEVLYRLESDKTMKIIPPTKYREKLFREAHEGKFGAHLRDAEIHGELSRHYWWPGMRSDILRWCKGCLTCASRRIGRPEKPPLTPIPVSGPFDRVGVDVIQFPMSFDGNRYAVVFMDYLTKWPVVFAVPDQTSLTIAHLLVDRVITRHGVPAELLSDRGKAFLSELMQEVYRIMGIHKVSTTAYHPQTDGLVERFNRTLTDMLATTVEKSGRDWDQHLPHVSTRESPFYLLYRRDPQLPTDAALCVPKSRYTVDLDDYKTGLVESLSEAWELARAEVKKAQSRQKKYYDRQAKEPKFRVGDRVFVYMPSAKKGKAHKFSRPFHGPFRVLELTPNDAKVTPVDKPRDQAIYVTLERLCFCPSELAQGEFWPSKSRQTRNEPQPSLTEAEETVASTEDEETVRPNVWKGRLRKRS